MVFLQYLVIIFSRRQLPSRSNDSHCCIVHPVACRPHRVLVLTLVSQSGGLNLESHAVTSDSGIMIIDISRPSRAPDPGYSIFTPRDSITVSVFRELVDDYSHRQVSPKAFLSRRLAEVWHPSFRAVFWPTTTEEKTSESQARRRESEGGCAEIGTIFWEIQLGVDGGGPSVQLSSWQLQLFRSIIFQLRCFRRI